MDSFREWLSDNLRYILLGLAIILVLVIAIFVVRLVGGSGDSSGKDNKVSTESTTETNAESETGTQAQQKDDGEPLVEDDASILETVQNYYTAMANRDMDTLSSLVESFSESDQQKIESSIIESYSNIKVYSKKGLTEGSYVVYPYYEAKVQDVEELVPSLGCLYLETNEDGSLYVADQTSDTEIQDYIESTRTDTDVQNLINTVSEQYNTLLDSNETLKSMMEGLSTPETEVKIPDSSEAGVQVNKVVQAIDVVNVRADSTEDAEVLGTLAIGETVTRVRQLDNGWSEIKYGDGVGYAKSEYLTEDVSTQ